MMKIQAVLRAISVIIGTLGAIGLTSIVLAQSAPPPDRAQRPDAYLNLYVDRSDDANVLACTSADNDCTLRGAINRANGDGANIYTIYFTPTVTVISLTNPLPAITANALWILDNAHTTRIDAAGMSLGDPFTIRANDVRLHGLSIVNGRSVGDGGYADIRIISGTRNLIDDNYLGTLPPAPGVANCTPNGVTRNSAYGIVVSNTVTGTTSADGGAAYIYSNTIGCHGGVGILLAGADYVGIGLSPSDYGSNFIGTNKQGVPLSNTLDGIALIPRGSDAPQRNIIAHNIIVNNERYGIALSGNGTPDDMGTTQNVIVANRIGVLPDDTPRGNGLDGVYLSTSAYNNTIGALGGGEPLGNLIGGNGRHGIQVANAPRTSIVGNSIGVNYSMTLALGNAGSGLVLKGAARAASSGEGSVFLNSIGSNGVDGIQLDGAVGHELGLNFIGGTPASTTLPFPNHRHGVLIFNDSYSNTIIRSFIAFNGGDGIRLEGSGTVTNTLDSMELRANQGHGLAVQNGAHHNTLGTARYGLEIYSNTLHGLYFASGAHDNLINSGHIYSNTGYGALLENAGTQRNVISGTVIYANHYDGLGERSEAGPNIWWHASFYDNGGLGVDRYAADDLLNVVHPPTATITSVVQAGAMITVSGTSAPIAYVDVYGIALDSSGYGEGKKYLGSVFTSSGQWSLLIDASPRACLTLLEHVPGSSTSEFSASSCRVFLPAVLK
jgi:hypothetical protein